jgi:hypothetical protein
MSENRPNRAEGPSHGFSFWPIGQSRWSSEEDGRGISSDPGLPANGSESLSGDRAVDDECRGGKGAVCTAAFIIERAYGKAVARLETSEHPLEAFPSWYLLELREQLKHRKLNAH